MGFEIIIPRFEVTKLAAAIGKRLPAYATASGKAVLAFLPEEMVRRFIERGMPQLTSLTHASPETFLDDLNTIRERGFAISEEEYEDAINAVAAPIFDLGGQPIASIAVAGPAYRLTRERMREIGPVVIATARDITREIHMAAVPLATSTISVPVTNKGLSSSNF